MYAVFVRGEAYLAAHQGTKRPRSFKRFSIIPGFVLNQPIRALAHLGLSRAFVMQGDSAKAKAAYQNFHMLWKGRSVRRWDAPASEMVAWVAGLRAMSRMRSPWESWRGFMPYSRSMEYAQLSCFGRG
jgi:hypothetical protein